MSDSESILTPSAVQNLIRDCLFANDELQVTLGEAITGLPPVGHGGVEAEGIIRTFVFHKERLESHRDEVRALLLELPGAFTEGWSFLEMCMNREGLQWTGEHMIMEELMVLGIALGLVEYCMPRKMWSSMPGGMPYLRVKL